FVVDQYDSVVVRSDLEVQGSLDVRHVAMNVVRVRLGDVNPRKRIQADHPGIQNPSPGAIERRLLILNKLFQLPPEPILDLLVRRQYDIKAVIVSGRGGARADEENAEAGQPANSSAHRGAPSCGSGSIRFG